MKRLRELLKQGASPDVVAMSIGLGATIGLFPIVGFPTPLCLLVGVRWKLSHPAMQAANWLTYPVYIPAAFGLTMLGQSIYGGAPLELTSSGVWRAVLYSATGWAIVAPFVWALVYFPARTVLRRLQPAVSRAAERA
ncbi:MAG: DUF2062 domain-containing protein [Elusimicrobia bacterium]|nr:DUF2062 domain-containing protein [Elusimicrobiota bacterium]